MTQDSVNSFSFATKESSFRYKTYTTLLKFLSIGNIRSYFKIEQKGYYFYGYDML